MTIRHGALALALFAFAAPAAAEPPIWVVSDEDSRMVLFPTIHILPPEIEWRSEALERELAQAEEVWFEADLSEKVQAGLVGLTLQLGFDPATPLADRLPAELHARAVGAAAALGMPAPAIEPMQPWLLAVTLSVVAITKAGYDPESGVEKVLKRELDGQEFRFLETAEQQLRFFADLDESVQHRFLDYTLVELDSVEEDLNGIVSDWAAGSVEGLADKFVVEMREKTPAVYEALLVRRNADWVDQLTADLEGAGTDFVAVGAAHLVGEDGLPTLLAERGYTVERVTP